MTFSKTTFMALAFGSAAAFSPRSLADEKTCADAPAFACPPPQPYWGGVGGGKKCFNGFIYQCNQYPQQGNCMEYCPTGCDTLPPNVLAAPVTGSAICPTTALGKQQCLPMSGGGYGVFNCPATCSGDSCKTTDLLQACPGACTFGPGAQSQTCYGAPPATDAKCRATQAPTAAP